jgi:hypothetical protein
MKFQDYSRRQNTMDEPTSRPPALHSRVEGTDGAYLALQLETRSMRGAASLLNEMMNESGLLARPAKDGEEGVAYSGFRDWKIAKREEAQGRWSFLGPDFQGRSLARLVEGVDSEESAAAALSLLSGLSGILASAEDKGIRIPAFSSESLLVGDSGDFLILPGALARRLVLDRARQGMAGRGAAGARAFGRPRGEVLADCLREIAMRSNGTWSDPRQEALPLSLLCPRLAPSLLEADRACREKPEKFNPARWRAALLSAAPAYFSDIAPQAAKNADARRKNALAGMERKARLSAWTKGHKPLLGILAAMLAIAAVALPVILQKRAEERRYIALGPDRLVAAFYEAYSSLNDADMDICVKDGSLKGELTMVSNLSALLKVRFASERRDPFVRAGSWLAAGRPPVAMHDYIFGFVDLRAEPVSVSEDAASFKATYTFWNSAASEDDIGYRYTSRPVTDEVDLVRTESGWKVSALRRTEGPETEENVALRTGVNE